MEANKTTNPYAFPIVGDSETQNYLQEGMTLRDYFAAKAMAAIINREGVYSNGGPGSTPSGVVPSEAAKHAYNFADAMLKARLSALEGNGL